MTTRKPDFAQLVRDIAAGNQRAEDRLVRYFHPIITGFLAQRTREHELARDLVQDTMIIVLQKLRQNAVTQPERLPAFVYQTARYVHLGWVRRSDNRVTLLDNADLVSDTATPDAELACIRDAEASAVRQMLQKLRMARDTEILTRRYLADETKEEICAGLGLSAAHFDRVLSRARKRLAVEVEASASTVPTH